VPTSFAWRSGGHAEFIIARIRATRWLCRIYATLEVFGAGDAIARAMARRALLQMHLLVENRF
jgi:hypothetical protein